jgi:hypothetical protein
LKENTANKSTTTTLGTSDVLFPTQNAVKTYVDNQVANVTATNVSGVVAVANGGTGSATQNFVDLTNNQNVAGSKNFSSNISTNQVTVGSPATGSQNTMLGAVAFGYASPGNNNTALGFFTLASLNGGNDNTAVGTNAIRQGGAANGNRNTALGSAALSNGSAPSDNTAIGYSTLAAGLTGGSNTAVGSYAFQTNTSGSNNVGVGKNAGITNTTGSNNTLIGTDANVGANNLSNTTALGYGAVATASNTIQLGNTAITNVLTSGTITAGNVTIPNLHGTANQVLTTNGSGTLVWSTPSTTATSYSGVLPIANGGTGSLSQNFVDLTTTQSIAGAKTFSSPITVQSNTLKGNGSGSFRNVGLGLSVFNASLTGTWNTAIGAYSMERLTSGSNNTGIGNETVSFITTTSNNTGIGNRAIMNTTGSNNTALGSNAAVQLTTGDNNLFLGNSSGTQIANNSNLTSLSNSVLIGPGARIGANGETNEIVIGYNAVGNGSNTIQLGNASITNVNTKGSITANAEISSEITANLTINNANSEQYKAKVLICNPTSQITITFSNDLPVGFNCMVLQKSADANKIVLAGGTGVTLKNRNNYTATAGNYAIATIVNIGGGIIVTAGDMQ